jgi:hypothetical protein
MSARDDYPYIATLATSGRVTTWAPTRDQAREVLDEIDRLRQQLDRIDDWLDGQGFLGVDYFAAASGHSSQVDADNA